MRFWDASAITPLLLRERSTSDMRKLLRDDRSMVVWWATGLECLSAVRRRERESKQDPRGARVAVRRLEGLAAGWSEVLPSDRVRSSAERALAVHPLRAADALQLAAALAWEAHPARTADLVCLDERLREAAAKEGFRVLPEEREG